VRLPVVLEEFVVREVPKSVEGVVVVVREGAVVELDRVVVVVAGLDVVVRLPVVGVAERV